MAKRWKPPTEGLPTHVTFKGALYTVAESVSKKYVLLVTNRKIVICERR